MSCACNRGNTIICHYCIETMKLKLYSIVVVMSINLLLVMLVIKKLELKLWACMLYCNEFKLLYLRTKGMPSLCYRCIWESRRNSNQPVSSFWYQ